MSTHTAILEYAAQHPEQVLGAVGAVGATAYHTVKTGSIPLGRLPWRAFRDVLGELRDRYYGKARPKGVPAVVVNAKPAEVKKTLRDRHFEGTQFAHEYEGERYNLRRPAGTDRHPDTGRPTPMEAHVRLFETGDGATLALAHREASRYEAQGVHYRGTMLSWPLGRAELLETLKDTALDYRQVASERDAEIEVV